MRFKGKQVLTLVFQLVVTLCLVTLSFSRIASANHTDEIVLWHSYRATEQDALMKAIETYEAEHPTHKIRVLAVPHDAFASKLSTAIPRGHGPDLFIFAHERIGSWVASKIVAPISLSAEEKASFFPITVEAFTYKNAIYGFPLSFKCLALFYNKKLVLNPPTTTDDLVTIGRALTRSHRATYALAYATDEFYFHAPWLFGFGGTLFDETGRVQLNTKPMIDSFRFAQRLVLQEGIVPQEANTALATRLFNDGSTAMVINGPWFVGEIDDAIDYGIAPIPEVSETHHTAKPFLTVEGIVLSAHSHKTESALQFARYLAGEKGSKLRATIGKQPVAHRATYDDPDIARDEILSAFRRQLEHSVIMNSSPAMQALWEPAKGALKAALRGDDPKTVLTRAQHRLKAATRTAPPLQNPTIFLIVLGCVSLIAVAWIVKRHVNAQFVSSFIEGQHAYGYVAPTMIGLLFLAILPFTVALGIAFCHHEAGHFFFVGFANFRDILLSESYGFTDPLSFYFTLGVTVLWTVVNVALHLTIGVGFALILREPWLKFKGVYRALLIVPWAVPNYITALIWKGMFHKQYGALNQILSSIGLEPVSWFSQFSTAFAANVITNTWLGFPFMMVVALGALQSIPSDLYEAADVDGASRWSQFRWITLPLLKPALLPAALLGMIWTFNMFNIVYLVSGGEPDGSTDILISEAYRWAFQRQEQYGYAAAYATLIFCILVAYTLATRRLSSEKQES